MAKRRSFPGEIFDPSKILAPALERGVAAWAQAVLPQEERRQGGTEPAEAKLLTFTREAWPIIYPMTPFVDGWVVGCICEHLQAMQRMEIPKLVINAPPRHFKSGPANVFLPAWVWTAAPAFQFIFAAYGKDLIDRDQDYFRRIIKSPWYRQRWGHQFSVTPGQDRIGEVWNSRGGGPT